MTFNTRTTTSLLLVALLLPFQTSAFVVSPATAAVSSTAAYASTIYSDFQDTAHPYPSEESVIDAKYTTPVNKGRALSSSLLQKMEMPRHGPTTSELETTQRMMSLEMTVGRGAMMVAVALMATELSTGMSLPEQLSKMLS